MAVVFSDEIEELLRNGPPKIDWDAITAQLKAEFLAGPGRLLDVAFDGDGAEGPSDPVREEYTPVPTLVVHNESTGGVLTRCCMWSCLHMRTGFSDLCVDRPVVYASKPAVVGLKSLAALWVTFSSASVRELNELGIDSVVTTRRVGAKRIAGAVVYRGVTDSEADVARGCAVMLPSLVGTVSYVTAHCDDQSLLARSAAHLFSQGGRVCGYASRDSECGICGDTGLVVGTLYGAPIDVDNALPYCVCSVGEWREAKADADSELDNGAYVMGRYDGGHSDDGRCTRWSDDEAEFERGSCFEVPGTPLLTPDVSSYRDGVVEVDEVVDIGARVGGNDKLVPYTGTGSVGHQVTEEPIGQAVGPGYCYLAMVKQGMDLEAVANLRDWPSVGDLLLSPASVFDLVKMRDLVFEVSDNIDGHSAVLPQGIALHVSNCWRATGRRLFVLEALTDVCRVSNLVYSVGTLAHALCGEPSLERFRPYVAMDDLVGGDSEPAVEEVGSSVFSPSTWSPKVTPPAEGEPGVSKVGAHFVKTYKAVRKPDGTYGAEVSTYFPKSGGTSYKVLCDVCKCMVHPDGHEARCVVPVERTSNKFTVEAWVGDAQHALDVRAVLATRGLEPAQRHEAYTQLVEAPGQAEYYLSLDVKPEEVIMQGGKMPKPHTIASMFERYYTGLFRERYLRDVFGVTPRIIEALVATLMTGTALAGSLSSVPARRYAVVMPPGHGKSVLHGVGRLVDADILCPVATEPLLAGLRSVAGAEPVRSHTYVGQWGRMLSDACGPGQVLLSSSAAVAGAAGFTVVAVLLIEEDAWLASCSGLSEDKLSLYKACCKAAAGHGAFVRTFESHYALRVGLNGIANKLSTGL